MHVHVHVCIVYMNIINSSHRGLSCMSGGCMNQCLDIAMNRPSNRKSIIIWYEL